MMGDLKGMTDEGKALPDVRKSAPRRPGPRLGGAYSNPRSMGEFLVSGLVKIVRILN